VTRLFRGNPRLLVLAVPTAVGMVPLKWLYDESELRHLDFSPLLTGVIAAEVFIIGFILSGTTADFKEADAPARRTGGERGDHRRRMPDRTLNSVCRKFANACRCWQKSARPSATGCGTRQIWMTS
jgi:hypothetical protein